MSDGNKYNITIECGADFVLPFTWYDDNGTPVDLTGATIEAQLRETSSSPDAYDFVCTHNGAGGKITLTLTQEVTSQIAFSYGVYDVFVNMPAGGRKRPLYGDVYVQDHVTKPTDGEMLYMIGIGSYDDLPTEGIVNRLYYCYDDRKIYRWNGQNYIPTSVGKGILRIELHEHVNSFVDKYRITYDDLTTWDYYVTNGGVSSVEKIGSTGTVKTGIVDTYRMYFYGGTTYADFTVTNGRAFDVKESYDATQAYEYLDMVRSGGSTYVAIQNVPVNTAITNTAYWQKIISNIAIGTVNTVAFTEGASATITGTPDAPVLNLWIPRGAIDDEVIDDTAGLGNDDKVWSACKTYREIKSVKDTVDTHDESIDDINRKIKNSFALKFVCLSDDNHNHLVDANENYLVGKTYLPITDKFLTSDIYPAPASAVGEIKNELDYLREDIQNVSSLFEYRYIAIINNAGEHLVDNNGALLIGIGLVPKNDKTLTSDIYPAPANIVGDIKDSVEELRDDFDVMESLFEYKNVQLANNNGEKLIDKNFKKLSGKKLLPITDITGTQTGIPMDAGMVGHTFEMEYKNLGLPIMYLTHPNIPDLKSKADGELKKVKFFFPSKNIEVPLKKFKIQGNSTQYLPKKNYTLTFDTPVVLNDDWGSHKKYVIKAEWTDQSFLRNVVSAKLWGEIRKTRINPTRDQLADNNSNHLIDASNNVLSGETEPSLAFGLNYGAIDGLPIMVVINDQYWGLYNLCIPKDDWMAGMGSREYETILSSAGDWEGAVFRKTFDHIDEEGLWREVSDNNYKLSYELEYTNDEDEIDWILTSINRMVTEVKTSGRASQQAYYDAISPYLDIDTAIDYYIFSAVSENWDGVRNNYILDTWDGTKWYIIAYDLDNTWGKQNTYSTIVKSFYEMSKYNKLFEVLYYHMMDRIIGRWDELRETVLSKEGLYDLFYSYAYRIPQSVLDYEMLLWSSRRGAFVMNFSTIISWMSMRIDKFDKEIDALRIGE